ncbi:MAG: hypothetical protein M1820_002111 [Bogoriella megaspora]|nr:MAG: hypothetical protein M1820_002111 [Bogoriella megaspora]
MITCFSFVQLPDQEGGNVFNLGASYDAAVTQYVSTNSKCYKRSIYDIETMSKLFLHSRPEKYFIMTTITTEANVTAGPPTTQSAKKKLPEGSRLVFMNLESQEERDFLHAQRIICGWGSVDIPKWRDSISKGHRTLFWIVIPTSYKTEKTPLLRRPATEEILAVGHVALDKVDKPAEGVAPDVTLAAPDGSVLLISTLFVLPTFQSYGLGAFAMDAIEAVAQEEPYGSKNCRATTINTLAKKYFESPDNDPTGRRETPPSRNNIAWYERRGYVAYSEYIRYYEIMPDGGRCGWCGVCMRKELGLKEAT